MTIVIIGGKQYEAELNQDGSYKAPPQLIPDIVPEPKKPFKQEFLAEIVQLGGDKLTKLNKLMQDPVVGLFLQVCLNDTGSFNPILINALKEHVIKDKDLGQEFWDVIEATYQKVRSS